MSADTTASVGTPGARGRSPLAPAIVQPLDVASRVWHVAPGAAAGWTHAVAQSPPLTSGCAGISRHVPPASASVSSPGAAGPQAVTRVPDAASIQSMCGASAE